MDETNINILVDAKKEYTDLLISNLRTSIYEGIKSFYDDSKALCDEDNTPDNVLMSFQKSLENIPKWSQELINREYNNIVQKSDCDWIEDLITAIFVSHTKVLTIIHKGRRNVKINLKIPKPEHFSHLCYIECAREFYKHPYLFSETVSKIDYQRNMRDCEGIISEAIRETIRKNLPVKHILQEYCSRDHLLSHR